MVKKIFMIMLAALLFGNVASAAQAVQIGLSVNKSEVAVGDTLQVTVTLKNATTGNLNIGNVSIPGIDKFRQQGSSQSTQVQMINGVTTAVTKTTLTLVAAAPGDYTIGPVQINAGNNLSATSNTVNVKVTSAQNSSPADVNVGANASPAQPGNSGASRGSAGTWALDSLAAILFFGMVYALVRQKRNIGAVEQNEADISGEHFSVKLPAANDPEFFEKTKLALLGYIRREHNIDTEVLTSQEVIDELKRNKVYNVSDFQRALELCDQGNFATDKSGTEELIKIIERFK